MYLGGRCLALRVETYWRVVGPSGNLHPSWAGPRRANRRRRRGIGNPVRVDSRHFEARFKSLIPFRLVRRIAGDGNFPVTSAGEPLAASSACRILAENGDALMPSRRADGGVPGDILETRFGGQENARNL
jgi:hypothetical protein